MIVAPPHEQAYSSTIWSSAIAFAPNNVHATRWDASGHGARILNGTAWLKPVVALHENVRASLPEHQRHFLLPKPESYFRDLLNGIDGMLFGFVADEELVGSMALVLCNSWQDAVSKGKLTAPDETGKLKKKYGKGHIGIIQAMGLTPPYVGRGLSRLLLQAAVHQAAETGCAHLFAQIAEQNTLSWLRFMDQDFAIVKAWTDGHRRFLMRWLPPAEKARLVKKAKPADRMSYAKTYAQMPAILAQLNARLKQNRMALLDTQSQSVGALNVVFGSTRRTLW